MTYSCLQEQQFRLGPYQLTPLRHQDIFDIKKWRNEQMAILRQRELLTDEMQEKYYQKVIVPSFSAEEPQQILFSYLLNERCIGYGGIVYIDWHSKRGEISFLLETHRVQNPLQYRQDFIPFLQLIKKVAFDELQFHRLYTETFDIRPDHIALLEEMNFAFEGRMKDHVLVKGKFVDSLIHGCIKHD